MSAVRAYSCFEQSENSDANDDHLTTYVKLDGQSLARVKTNRSGIPNSYTDTVTYLHNDHLGSAGSGTLADGSVAWREEYSPFGVTMVNNAANDNQAGFTGHVKDSDTGLIGAFFVEQKLHDMQARYYDPVIGRFLSIDPVTFMDTGNPDFFNRYSYTANDPINNIDPDGKAKLKFFVETVKGVRKRVTRKQAQNSRNNQKNVDVRGPKQSQTAKRIESRANPDNVVRHDAHKAGEKDHYQPAKRGKGDKKIMGHTNYGGSSSSSDAGTFESALSVSDTFGSNAVTEALDMVNPAADVGYALDGAVGAANDLNDATGFSESVSDAFSDMGAAAHDALEKTQEFLGNPF